jgi:hypothetical protein
MATLVVIRARTKEKVCMMAMVEARGMQAEANLPQNLSVVVAVLLDNVLRQKPFRRPFDQTKHWSAKRHVGWVQR